MTEMCFLYQTKIKPSNSHGDIRMRRQSLIKSAHWDAKEKGGEEYGVIHVCRREVTGTDLVVDTALFDVELHRRYQASSDLIPSSPNSPQLG